MPFYVYILASERNGTLYIGVTNDIVRRVTEHREGVVDGFTERHGVKQLVHVEIFEDARSAITREKQMKKWRRAWKLRLIEKENPKWRDRYDEICR
jgi:putative endonuclease